jgi:hypothetical protein
LGKFVLAYDHWTPDSFRVLVNSIGELEKVAIATTATYGEGNKRETQNVIKIWTSETFRVRGSNGDVLEEVDNEYGFLPFVLMRLEDGDLYDGGATDLVEGNLYVNYLKLLENTDATFAAVNVFIHRNLGLSNAERVGMREAFGLSGVRKDEGLESPSAEFVSGNPNSQILRELIIAEERSISMRAGMAAFMLSDSPTELSGKAMKIAMSEGIEARQDDASAMEMNERANYVMSAYVLNWHRERGEDVAGIELPTDPEVFNVNFGELEFNDDPKAEFELDMMKAEKGIISIAAVARKDNTDAESDQELLDIVAKNKADMSRFTAKGFRSALLNAVKQEPKDDKQEPDDKPDTLNTLAKAGNE